MGEATNRVNELLSAVMSAGDCLMLSRKHCHARNVSSIVVRSHSGMLARAFLAWPGHELATNRLDGCLAVGIHDHRYGLSLSSIRGNVRNTTYLRSDGVDLCEWRFRTGVTTGRPELEYVGRASLKVEKESYLDGGWLTMQAQTLHNIDCTGVAGWWVQEGKTAQEVTALFTKKPIVNVDGLYEPFSCRDQVIQHVEAWAAIH